jgi:hypothetical protein
MRRPGRTPMTELTADMRAVIQAAHLCFAATVHVADAVYDWHERREALDQEFET